jgi:hypothetical protein
MFSGFFQLLQVLLSGGERNYFRFAKQDSKSRGGEAALRKSPGGAFSAAWVDPRFRHQWDPVKSYFMGLF